MSETSDPPTVQPKDGRLELIESFWHDELDCLVDVYWNGRYGHLGVVRAKILRTDEWLDEIDVEARAERWNGDDDA